MPPIPWPRGDVRGLAVVASVVSTGDEKAGPGAGAWLGEGAPRIGRGAKQGKEVWILVERSVWP